jgi:hypothetical protein
MTGELIRREVLNAITCRVMKYPLYFLLPENPNPGLVEVCLNDILLTD